MPKGAGNNYSILLGVEIDTKKVKQQLESEFKNTKINIDSSSAKEATKAVDDLGSAANNTSTEIQNFSLDFNAANEIFRTTIDIIGSMIEQVFDMNEALIEFQKVSDLSGDSLNEYVNQLNQIGDAVGRTGKLIKSEPECMDGKHALRTVQKPGRPKAYLTTMLLEKIVA